MKLAGRTLVQRKCSAPGEMILLSWELVSLIFVRTFRGRFELCVLVKRHVAKFLFTSRPIPPFYCGGRERVPALSDELHQRI